MRPPAHRPLLAAALIRVAARRAPVTLCARLEEEWLAHLETTTTPWSAVTLALGCCWASRAIATADRQDPVPAQSSVLVRGGAVTVGDRELKYLSLRPVTLFLIVELQATLLCGLVLPL